MPTFDLLDSNGRPNRAAIERVADERIQRGRREPAPAHYVARVRPQEIEVAEAQAFGQALRWGKTPDQVRVLDIYDEIAGLDYDYRSRAAVSADRHRLTQEREAIEARLEAAIRAPLPVEFERAA